MNAPVVDLYGQCLSRRLDLAYEVGHLGGGIKTAILALELGNASGALEVLRKSLATHEARETARKATPPALPEAEMAQLIAEDEAADRRQAAWERAKEIAERNGEEN